MSVVYVYKEEMAAPMIVYIYGRPGCGKSKLLSAVFGKTDGVSYRGAMKVVLMDGVGYGFTLATIPQCDYLIITSNMQPESIPIHIDHVFCLDCAQTYKECRKFLESLYASWAQHVC